ncbi:MAG: DoxX family protein [Vicinamibacterales bacterium]
MNVTLWVVQVLLAAAFLAHGVLFLAPPPEIAVLMDATLPRWFQLFLGVAEVAAAAGLTLPGITRVLPGLVAWAAAGIVVVMVSATVFHLARGEGSSAATTFALLCAASFVTWARWRVRPIAARARR